MQQRRMASTQLGGGNGRVKTGASRTRRQLAPADLKAWQRFYLAAISGAIAAQAKTPDAKVVAKWCVEFADAALRECRKRHHHRGS